MPTFLEALGRRKKPTAWEMLRSDAAKTRKSQAPKGLFTRHARIHNVLPQPKNTWGSRLEERNVTALLKEQKAAAAGNSAMKRSLTKIPAPAAVERVRAELSKAFAANIKVAAAPAEVPKPVAPRHSKLAVAAMFTPEVKATAAPVLPAPQDKPRAGRMDIAAIIAAADEVLKRDTKKAVQLNVPAIAAAAAAAEEGEPPVKPGARPGERFLCDADFTQRILTSEAKIDEIYASKGKLGEGTFGFTTSAEIYMKSKKGSNFNCIGALKTSKLQQSDLPEDVLTEIATYARLRASPCLAKGLYIKLLPGQIKTVMEHYIIDLDKLFTAAVFPMWDRLQAIDLEKLCRGIMYQILYGLNEMHHKGMIHRDFKPENALLAHDGRIYVTDYGLSFHNPYGFQYSQDFYTRAGTPTTQAPESLLNREGYDPRYDVWSAGCSMAFFMTAKYHFDMWHTDGKNWMAMANRSKYETRLRKIFEEVAHYKVLSAPGVAFLKRLLSIDPARRPNAKQALDDPWFAGMTLAKAQEYVNRYIGQFMLTKTQTIRTGTKRKGNAEAVANTNLDSYIRIVPAESSGTLWQPWVGSDEMGAKAKITYVGRLFSFASAPYNISLGIIVHAIEILERVLNASGVENITHKLVASLIIAWKISELKKRSGMYISSSHLAKIILWVNETAVNSMEREIVKLLGGDLFIQKDGFAEQFMKGIIEDRSPIPGTRYKFLRTVLAFLVYGVNTSNAKTLTSTFRITDVFVRAVAALERAPGTPLVLDGEEREVQLIIQRSGDAALRTFFGFFDPTIFNNEIFRSLFGTPLVPNGFAPPAKASDSLLATIKDMEYIITRHST